MRVGGLIKGFITRKKALSDRRGASDRGHFSVMANHTVTPPSYVARDLVRGTAHHVKGVRKTEPKAMRGFPAIYLRVCEVLAQTLLTAEPIKGLEVTTLRRSVVLNKYPPASSMASNRQTDR